MLPLSVLFFSEEAVQWFGLTLQHIACEGPGSVPGQRPKVLWAACHPPPPHGRRETQRHVLAPALQPWRE